MKADFSTTNLSKIQTKFRTSGAISQPRRKAGSPMREIGVTTGNVGSLPKREEYLETLKEAYKRTDDPKLKQYIYQRIRDLTF